MTEECRTGKMRHRKKAQAARHQKNLARRRRDACKNKPYLRPYCDGWHTGLDFRGSSGGRFVG